MNFRVMLAVMFSVYLLLAPKCMSGICPLHAVKRWAIKRFGHHHNWCSSLNSMARTSSRRQLEVSTIQIYYVKYFAISLRRANRFHEPPMVKGEEVRTGMCDSDMPPFLASITTYTEGRKDHMCQRETQNPHPACMLHHTKNRPRPRPRPRPPTTPPSL